MVSVSPFEEGRGVKEDVVSDLDNDDKGSNGSSDNQDEEMDDFEIPDNNEGGGDGGDDDGEEEEEEEDENDEFPVSVFGVEEKKRLEKEREKRRQSIRLEKESLRESRVIFFRMKEQMSPEQLRRIRLVMGKLIAMSPPIADDRAKLAKAFVIWAEKLPLFLKCDELRRQFDERGIALEVLRDSYYRDVLSVKQHVERIYKNQDMPLELKELCGSVPSMDYRKLIERSYTDSSSNQLRDGLMSTRLVSEQVKKKWGTNPWEQGHAYQVYKRINPERLKTGGATLNLYAPCRHRLYIKYCRSCVGIMSLVNDWNKDVEIAINTKMADDTNKELREVIKNLNRVIAEMTSKMTTQSEVIDGFEKGNKWWGEWAKKQTISSDAELKIQHLRAKSHRWENTARMTLEEQLTMRQNFEIFKIDAAEQQIQLQKTLDDVTATSVETGVELNSEIDALKLELEASKQREEQQNAEIEQLTWANQKSKEDNNRLKRLNGQLNNSLDEKDRQMAQYREDTINRIENLTSQIAELTTDLENQEREYDRISDLLEQEKLVNSENQATMNALQDEVGKMHNVLREKDKQIEKLETVEENSSDDDSDGITEELLEDYKEALQYMPRAMRKEVARNMETFGFEDDEEDEYYGEFDSAQLTLETIADDDNFDGEAVAVVKDLYTEDDFSFQRVPRRESEIANSGGRPTVITNHLVPDANPPPKTLQSYTSVSETPARKPSVASSPKTSRMSISRRRNIPKQASMSALDISMKRRSTYKQRPSPGTALKQSSLTSSPKSLSRTSSRRNFSQVDSFTDEELDEMREEGIRKANLKKNMLKLVPMLAPFIKPPKLTFKVVAIAVRFMVRFKKAIDTQDFHLLGLLGRKEELRRAHKEYEQLPVTIKHLEYKLQNFSAIEAKYKDQIENMSDTIARLSERNSEYVERAASHAGDIEALNIDVKRQHIIGQCQRNFAAELSETLGIIRNRIYMLIKYEGDIPVSLREEDANKLEDKSIIRELTEEEEEEERLRMKYRVTQLFRKLRVHVMDISNFVQENKRIRPISTFALGKFPDFYSFGSKFRNELRNLQLFKKRALTDLSIVEKRWVVKTLKVCTSETNYRDLYFSRLCPSCLDGCERGLDGEWRFKKKKHYDRTESGRTAGSPKEIKALTDAAAKRVREEMELKYKEMVDSMHAEASALKETIKSLEDDVGRLKGSLLATEKFVEVLRDDVAEAKNKYDICKREVFVLRTAVQDSYRAIEENALQLEIEREGKRRVKGTQISCSVCAIRYEKEEHGHEGFLTTHVEESDRILFPRASRHLKRVKEIECLEKKKGTFAYAYAPFTGDNTDKPTTVTKHRNTTRSPKMEMRSSSVETEFGELMVVHPSPSQGQPTSKFSQMKNIPPSNIKGVSVKDDGPMSKIHVSKVASMLQSDAKIAKFKKLRDNNLLNLTATETDHMFQLLGSASKNNLDNKKAMKLAQRPISAPNHKR